jgi:hypothetical protein
MVAAIVIFLAGAAAGLASHYLTAKVEIDGDDPLEGTASGWRAEVAQFLKLYTRDTLDNLPDDRSLRQTELRTIGHKLGLGLSIDKVSLDGLVLKHSQLLNFGGRSLALIAYLAPGDGLLALCIIDDSESERGLSFERREG